MFSHIHIGISDFNRALAFYSGLGKILSLRLRFADHTKCWAGWMPKDAPRPLLLIGRPHNNQAPSAGNGQMAAFSVASRAAVDQTHHFALANGGSDEGAPGLRPEYHAHYYGCYFRDPDGNKLCVVCNEIQESRLSIKTQI